MSGSESGLNLSLLSRPRRFLLVGWFLATLALGTWGYAEYAEQIGADRSVWTALYHCAQLFLLHSPHFEHAVPLSLEFARWSAAVFLVGAVLRVGRQLFPNEFAAMRFGRFSNHVVIGGLGRRAVQCVRHERSRAGRRRQVVVIDRQPAEEQARECLRLGAQVITGNAADPAVLRSAGLLRAAELWALCPDDGVNCETAVQAEAVLDAQPGQRRKRGPVHCNIHLSDVDLRVELQRLAPRVEGSPVSLQFFDLYDREARRVLLSELPIDHHGIAATESRRPHLVIFGFGRMGRSVALRAAKLGHFANGVADPARRLRISVIDREGPAREEAFLFRYPRFREVCELTVHHLDLESPGARRLIEEWSADGCALTSLVVCFDDQARAVEVALRLLPVLRGDAVRVAVRVAHREGLGAMVDRLWSRPESGSRVRVRTFGRLDEGCCEAALQDTLEEKLAKAIHADFVTRRLTGGERDPDDRSVAPWPLLEEDLRESNRQQADHVVIKLRAIGADLAEGLQGPERPFRFTPDEVELLARMEHHRWNAERWLAGWSRGPKNVERRTSPFLCDWSELPEEIRGYDRAAVETIPALLAEVGLHAARSPG